MTAKGEPLLRRSGLTGTVYVVTSYRDHGEGRIEALKKYDVTDQFRALRDQDSAVELLRAALGDALMHIRLAQTAADLVADGFSDDRDEPNRILTLLCERLIAVGAVDPMEQPDSELSQ